MRRTPRILHRVWLRQGPDDAIPERYEGYWDAFRRLLPGWDLRTWEDEDEVLGWLRNRALYEEQTTHAGRSDVVRYEVLAREGGVYVDTDVEPLRSFDPLVRGELGLYPFAGWEDRRLICPTVMGSPPGHPAIEDLVRALPRYAARHRRSPPNVRTGPVYLTARWRSRTDVLLYAPVRFYPVHWSERDRLGGPYPEGAYAVHHWEQGWDPEARARVDARQASRR